MASDEIDSYLAQFQGPGLVTAWALRKQLRELLPLGEEGLSYAMPVIKLEGKAIAGYAIAKNHVGYYPHSSLILDKIPELANYKMSKGALQIPSGEVLAADLVRKLVVARLEQLGLSQPGLNQ